MRASTAGSRAALPLALAALPVLLFGTSCAGEAQRTPALDVSTYAERLDAQRVLDLAIGVHDPNAVWSTGRFPLSIEQTRPDGPTTVVDVLIDNGAGRFTLEGERDGRWMEVVVEPGPEGEEVVTAKLDGSSEITPEEARSFRFADGGGIWWRDYYLYLYGLPMKLRDPGTIVDAEARRETFEGRDGWAVRVTYDPEVGGDTWIFYFDPATWEMFGYRFYHDEAAGDGEYIVLDEIAEVAGLRLPKRRTWYTHQGDRLLGTDTLLPAETVTKTEPTVESGLEEADP